jgi:hypothetical protein
MLFDDLDEDNSDIIDDFGLSEVGEISEFWDYWIEEPVGEFVAEFSDLVEAMEYVDEAPWGVLWVYISDDGVEVWRHYEG